jgi:hypothetical protein
MMNRILDLTTINAGYLIYLILILQIVIIPIPIIKIIFGYVLYFKTPKMNRFFGFKTRKAYTNEDTWFFANNLFGKILFYTGIIETILFALFIFLIPNALWIIILLELITFITAIIGVIVVNIKLNKLISREQDKVY